MVKRKVSSIIYILSTILALILLIFIYRIIINISHITLDEGITISNYTGERIHNAYSVKPLKIATYINTNNQSAIEGLSSADVVLEFLSSSYGITYKAIFNQDAAKNISSKVSLKEYSNSYLPEFNFTDNIKMIDIKAKSATSIFITFNEDSSSNFLYNNGEYYHYRDLSIDKDTNTPVKLSNVIVQFIHGNIISDEALTTSENYGTGLLFCGGKVQDINWSRKKNSEIKIIDGNGAPISLMPGPTWWIFIDKECSVAYD